MIPRQSDGSVERDEAIENLVAGSCSAIDFQRAGVQYQLGGIDDDLVDVAPIGGELAPIIRLWRFVVLPLVAIHQERGGNLSEIVTGAGTAQSLIRGIESGD